MSNAWGIDLGTTNSCISRLVDGLPTAVQLDAGPIVPSVVMYGDDGVTVGREAHNLAVLHPDRCVRSVKRRMGRGPAYSIGGREISPEQVSAEILRALKQGAERVTGTEVKDVVITVPAYFDDAQRRATLRAGELSGLNVLRLLNEPTSASLIYERALESGSGAEPEIVMIYDLGGGTFDVSVLEVMAGVREVRATAGNSQLGGDDFDEVLYRRFADHLKHEHGVEVTSDPRGQARLRNLAEHTKIALSSQLEHTARDEFVTTDATGAPVHLELRITRRELEELVRPLLATTIELARRALDDAKLGAQRLSQICLVGGSTRIPLVSELLAETFDADIHREIDPDLAVGLGASVQAGLLGGEPVERILVDVAAHSLGIRVIGERDAPWDEPDTFAPVIRRNTVLPADRSKEFYTAVDEQERMKVEVFQGESRRASENRLVGTFDVPLEPQPAQSPVGVTFAYDLDGVIRVTVQQEGTANVKTAQLRVADAAETATPDPPVLRRARALLTALDGEQRQAMEAAIATYEQAQAAQREQAEEALLDLLVDLEHHGGD